MLSSIVFLLGLVTISQCQNVSHQQNVPNTKKYIMKEVFNFREVINRRKVPPQVSLYNFRSGGLLCHGCLINPLYVVTSLHCVHSRNIKDMAVVAGINQEQLHFRLFATVDTYKDSFHIRPVKEIISPTNFTLGPFSCAGDIALVRLEQPFNITEEIGYAYLPDFYTQNYLELTDLLDKDLGIAIGYGLGIAMKASELTISTQLKLNTSSIDIIECQRKFRFIDIHDDQICVYTDKLFPISQSIGNDAWFISWVGEVLIFDNILIGTQACSRVSDPLMPTIFTDVSLHTLWILKEIIHRCKNDTYPASDKWHTLINLCSRN